MAKLTLSRCAESCIDRRPYRCCERMYCEMAIKRARAFGAPLTETAHPELPLMDPETLRCVAPAHLRPICAAHQCDIANLGHGPTEAWTKRYFRLRSAACADEDMDEIWLADMEREDAQAEANRKLSLLADLERRAEDESRR